MNVQKMSEAQIAARTAPAKVAPGERATTLARLTSRVKVKATISASGRTRRVA